MFFEKQWICQPAGRSVESSFSIKVDSDADKGKKLLRVKKIHYSEGQDTISQSGAIFRILLLILHGLNFSNN
jgi:hypothetical protein